MTSAATTLSDDPLGLEQAYAACRQITRTRARNFYYGLKLTPEPQRSAVYAMYAWMRTGDDLVDAAVDADAKRERLGLFTNATREALRGDFPDDAHVGTRAMWRAFADAIGNAEVRHEDIEAMLAGLGEDIVHEGYESFDDLKGYCRRVASSVGRVCVTIWGVRDGVDLDAAMKLADRRGLAFQLTNILRDYAEDYDDGRVYLFSRSFEDAGLSPDDVRVWRDSARCEKLVLDHAARARAEFDASAPLEAMITPACAPTLWAMTRIYSGILNKIEKRPERIVGSSRIRLQSLHKASIAMRAVVRSRRGAW